jgi:hypothetical protein
MKTRACWQCGCTDDRACPGGCSWLPGGTKPTCSNCATPTQVKVLRALYASPTIRSAMKAVGGLSTNAGSDHIRRLEDRGFVARRPGGRWGERWLTDRGLAAIGLKRCYHCKGTGVKALGR